MNIGNNLLANFVDIKYNKMKIKKLYTFLMKIESINEFYRENMFCGLSV